MKISVHYRALLIVDLLTPSGNGHEDDVLERCESHDARLQTVNARLECEEKPDDNSCSTRPAF